MVKELRRKKALENLMDEEEKASIGALNSQYESEEKGGRELDTPEMRKAVEDSHKVLEEEWETYKKLRQRAEDREYQDASDWEQEEIERRKTKKYRGY